MTTKKSKFRFVHNDELYDPRPGDVHIERMDDHHIWMRVGNRTFSIWSRGKIKWTQTF